MWQIAPDKGNNWTTYLEIKLVDEFSNYTGRNEITESYKFVPSADDKGNVPEVQNTPELTVKFINKEFLKVSSLELNNDNEIKIEFETNIESPELLVNNYDSISYEVKLNEEDVLKNGSYEDTKLVNSIKGCDGLKSKYYGVVSLAVEQKAEDYDFAITLNGEVLKITIPKTLPFGVYDKDKNSIDSITLDSRGNAVEVWVYSFTSWTSEINDNI